MTGIVIAPYTFCFCTAQHELKLQQSDLMTTTVASPNLSRLIVTHTALAVTYLLHLHTV